jgi:ribosomal protein L12E/L44/L45/RPP1/RPP2
MDDISEQREPSYIDMLGLSPEQIGSISANRVRSEQLRNQMFGMLAGQPQREAATAASESARELSEFKLQQARRNAEEVTITDSDDKSYKVQRGDLVNSIKAISGMKRDMMLNKLTNEQIKGLQSKVPLKVDGKSYQVSPTHYGTISEEIRKRKEAERKQTALNALEGKSLQEMTNPENFSNLLIANPGAAAAAFNKLMPEGDIDLTNPQYLKYADKYADLVAHVTSGKNPEESIVSVTNNLSRKLQGTTMVVVVPMKGCIDEWAGNVEAVSITLPFGWTVDKVYRIAELEGISVQEVLRTVYKGL